MAIYTILPGFCANNNYDTIYKTINIGKTDFKLKYMDFCVFKYIDIFMYMLIYRNMHLYTVKGKE